MNSSVSKEPELPAVFPEWSFASCMEPGTTWRQEERMILINEHNNLLREVVTFEPKIKMVKKKN